MISYRRTREGGCLFIVETTMPKRLAICLINPRSRPSYPTSDYAMPILGLGRRLKYSMANGSVLAVAALVPPEHEVVIVDENVENINFESFRRFTVRSEEH